MLCACESFERTALECHHAPLFSRAQPLMYQIGSRNDELGRFFKGAIGEVVVFPRALSAQELASMQV